MTITQVALLVTGKFCGNDSNETSSILSARLNLTLTLTTVTKTKANVKEL